MHHPPASAPTARPQAALALAALVASFVAAPSPVGAEPASPWARDGATGLRLIDAGAALASGGRLAAIEIALDAGWKTYWRQPGVSGVPPRFDFSGSGNLAEARVAYPTPERAADPDGVTNVYHGRVVLPVTVTPRDPAAAVSLKLVADYGVCEAVCVPVRAEAAIELAPGGGRDGPAAEDARAAAGAAPKILTLGGDGPLAVTSVARIAGQAGAAALEITARVPAGAGEPALFAETGDGAYAPAPEAEGPSKAGEARFRISFDESEPPASGLRLTLAAGGRAVETPVALDAITGKP